ncbi:RNA methyltransferase [Solimicrobium silvestre]|uniref:tRNA (cytidine/uridine-2'-O-)-methyltransferase TrmJ n=1 Tax=Solimicrobium silvestre TaxID=2099400 RepID=A0A2S9GUU2_9BURK|nr:RNA methyltransferase [Solimicrobium silvestre]PRC91468.1 RNA methyltransferase, TrmH family, group 1 [Solimicrobium silvestre]
MHTPALSTPSSFDRLRFVLVETSHPGNVGSVARAMKTMGYSSLYLVNPRFPDVLSHPEAIALASGAQDILENAIIVSTIQEALQGCEIAAAVSARLREFSPPIIDPREFAQLFNKPETGYAALVLGNERTGLLNELVEKCTYLINIPANPAYSSLNLAQAVQVLAYECRYGSMESKIIDTEIGFKGDSANLADIDAMFNHLEQGLIAINFIDPDRPKKLMSRLKRLFARTQLETEEVNILRGIAKKMLDK